MSLMAVLLTYLFFCHPHLLAALAIIFALIMLIVYAPAGLLVFVVIAFFFLLYKFLVG